MHLYGHGHAWNKPTGELSDEALEKVAGGSGVWLPQLDNAHAFVE